MLRLLTYANFLNLFLNWKKNVWVSPLRESRTIYYGGIRGEKDNQ